MSQILETVTAQLRADAGSFVTGFNRAEKSVQLFQQRAQGAAVFGGRLQNVLANTAFAAAGVPGPLGKISESLLMFAGGSALVLGVVAGLGLIATAFNKMGEAAEKSEEIARNAADMLTKRMGAIRGMGPDQLTNITAKIAELQKSLKDMEDAQVARGFSRADKTRAMVSVELQLGELLAKQNELLKERLKVTTDEKERRQLRFIVEENERMIPLLELQRDLEIDLRRIRAETAARAVPGMPTSPFGGLMAGDEQLFDRMARDVEAKTKELFGDPELMKDLQDLGVSAGRQFALGLIEGIEDMEDLLKRVALTVLDFFLTKGLTSVLSGGGGAKFLGDATGVPNTLMAPIEPMGLSINTGAIPPPMTPFDVARDAWWQRALRESVLVARSQGFK